MDKQKQLNLADPPIAHHVLLFVRNSDYGYTEQVRRYVKAKYPGKKILILNVDHHSPREMERCEVVVVKNLTDRAYVAAANDYRRLVGAAVDVFEQEPPSLQPALGAQLPTVTGPDAIQTFQIPNIQSGAADVEWGRLTKAQLQAECEARKLVVKGTGIRGSVTKLDYLSALGVEL